MTNTRRHLAPGDHVVSTCAVLAARAINEDGWVTIYDEPCGELPEGTPFVVVAAIEDGPVYVLGSDGVAWAISPENLELQS